VKQSVKNFQLVRKPENEPESISHKEKEEIFLQFGRKTDYTFILDFKYPLSPMQALAIALSSIDNKIACE
jgi:tubby-related protein 1